MPGTRLARTARPPYRPTMHRTTDRLTLRPFNADDGPALHAYLSRPDVVRFEPYGPMTLAACTAEARRHAGDHRFVAVCLPDGTLVGHVFHALEEPADWRTWTVGYVFHPDHWGHGYATEATRAVVDRCFTEQDAHRVVARCDPENTRSWRLLERLGMRREAHERANASFRTDVDGRQVWHDSLLYAVLDAEWPTS